MEFKYWEVYVHISEYKQTLNISHYTTLYFNIQNSNQSSDCSFAVLHFFLQMLLYLQPSPLVCIERLKNNTHPMTNIIYMDELNHQSQPSVFI